ncbi:MAG: M14 family metallopeptidase [Candidatus Krumholzibacteria bacterium]|nr:M14 family metallopeptidase [Candidatus Krumholzibacteria bacterium]
MFRRLIVFVSTAAWLMGSSAEADVMRTNVTPGVGDYDVPFYPQGSYREDVQSPSEFLGVQVGSWPASHNDILRYLRYLEGQFANVFLVEYGETYEGRTLVYVVISSQKNADRLQDIKARTAMLADPRSLKDDRAAQKIIASHPATAWMAYGIHGDELSSSDAALQLAYQLVAGTDPTTEKIRDAVVVCIDPLQNPDGRDRWLKQIEQWNGVVVNRDVQSLHHLGMWPEGRGNHYLFDLNRDWFSQVHPESRGKIAAILAWNPQFLVDCHEMGQLDTYLFSPPREPFNPFMILQIHKWWDVVARDQAAAFDQYGWSYYTREWNEEFFPGYGSSWAIYIGAIGMLYEQAAVDGSQITHRDGTIATYRETIHHQFTSSMANLKTVATNRQELLQDYYREKKRAINGKGRSSNDAAFVFPPTANVSRLDRLAQTLLRQKVEVEKAIDNFKVKRARASTGEGSRDVNFPPGSLIVRLAQPQRALIEAILTFDIRIATEFLETERRELLKNNRSEFYEATGWSLPMAYNVECYFTESLTGVSTEPYSPKVRVGRLIGSSPRYGYAVDGADDRSYSLLARLFDKDYVVWCAKKPFQSEGKRFAAGSLLIKIAGNPGLDESDLVSMAEAEGVDIYAVNKALGGELADLGGRHVVLLKKPRIAIIGGPPVSAYQFGTLWHLLDSRLRYKASTLDFSRVAGMDLGKYNVIAFPSAAGSDVYTRMLGKAGIDNLKAWVKTGGTLIAMDGATAFFADTLVAMSSVRQKRQVLDEITEYDEALAWLDAAEKPTVDSMDVWETKAVGAKSTERPESHADDVERLRSEDELARRLRPRGTIMAADLDSDHWLAFGARSPVPLLVTTSYAYVAMTNVQSSKSLVGDNVSRPDGVQVPARFASADKIRLSGLLWPEARRRWSKTIAVSREAFGNGQIVLFAMQPNFRAYFHGGERLLLNALFLGPGLGTHRSVDW